MALPTTLINDNIVFIPGQGLGDEATRQVLSLAAANHNGGQFEFSLRDQTVQRTRSAHSHKHFAGNTLISEPRRISEDVFEYDLLVDEHCELMRDHQTGRHLQGMIPVEAARQSLLAVTEAFVLPGHGMHYLFTFNELGVRFKRYAFPLGTHFRFLIREKHTDNAKRLRLVSVSLCWMLKPGNLNRLMRRNNFCRPGSLTARIDGIRHLPYRAEIQPEGCSDRYISES